MRADLLGEPGMRDVVVGDLSVTEGRTRVTWKGAAVRLTRNETRLVSALASVPGERMSYDVLHAIIYGRGFAIGRGRGGVTGNLQMLANRTRQMFKAADPDFTEIRSVHGVGYLWAAPRAKLDEDARRLATILRERYRDLPEHVRREDEVFALCDRILGAGA